MRISTLRNDLPVGGALPEAEVAARHRLIRTVLAVSLPVLAAASLTVGHPPVDTLAALAPPALLLAAASAHLPARIRTVAASLGLIACSAVAVHVADGVVEASFSYLVALTLVAVYEDVLVYLAGVAFVLVQPAISGVLDPASVFVHPGNPGRWATVPAVAILAQSGALVVLWRYRLAGRRREGRYRDQLYAGRDSVLSRQEQLARMRCDLVGTVSHEFRTPLTGIRGTLQLLQRHGDQLPPDRCADLLARALASTDRLTRLIDNMLAAAQPGGGDSPDATRLAAAAEDAVAAVRATHAGRPLRLSVSVSDVAVRMPFTPLRQVLGNLLDNAIVHGRHDGPVGLTAWRDGENAIVTIRNETGALDGSRLGELFEPFARADTSTTRECEGAGMGLYVVRRLVEHHGGSVSARLEGTSLTVRLTLPLERRGAGAPSPRTTSVPSA